MTRILHLGAEDLSDRIRKILATQQIEADLAAIDCFVRALTKYPALAPKYKSLPVDIQIILSWWLGKMQLSYSNRISQRSSKEPGTKPDMMVSKIIKARLGRLSDKDLKRISDAHRLSMSSENILGLLLEEFLATHLQKFGWFCAWGECIKSVDFVAADGRLLQIKNRSNSENSSSSKVRIGTDILKWYRVNATTGHYNWPALNQIVGNTCSLSEDVFEAFVQKTIIANPSALAVERNNDWA